MKENKTVMLSANGTASENKINVVEKTGIYIERKRKERIKTLDWLVVRYCPSPALLVAVFF